jgi:nitrite reductase (NADH) small subunit
VTTASRVTTGQDVPSWVDVCDAERVRTTRGICAVIEGVQIAVFRTPFGQLVGIGNRDPFSGANVISRGIVGSAGDRTIVASPMYKQRFDLETGECLDDTTVSIPVYSVREVDGRVEVQV